MRRDVVRLGVGDLVLLVTSLVAAAAIILAYAGRTRATAWSIAHDGEPAAIVNLSTVRSADELEPIVTRALESAPDSKFAARHLFQFLAPPDGRVNPPNVGSITRIAVPVDAILRDGLSPAQEMLARYHGSWRRSLAPLYTEYAF